MDYSDEQLEMIKQNPKFMNLISQARELNKYTVVAEVVESHGCNSGHKVGTKLCFDPFGNMLTKLCPSRVCLYALGPLQLILFHIGEALYAGHDPRKMVFNRCSCFDVGVQCGGWGQIIFDVKIIPRDAISMKNKIFFFF